MKITLETDIFLRLAKAAMPYNSDYRPHMACVRLEYRDGKAYAIASTSWVMAIEYIGDTDQPNDFLNVATEPWVITFLETQERVTFEGWQAANYCTIDMLGVAAPVKLQPEIEAQFTRWYDLAHVHTRDKGFLYIQEEIFRPLAMSSPSGKIVFPSVVDSSRVMYMRDADDPNWLGLIWAVSNDKNIKPATIPEWLP